MYDLGGKGWLARSEEFIFQRTMIEINREKKYKL
jgi:hypothetical protein